MDKMYFTEKGIKYLDHLDGSYTLLKPLVLITDNWETITAPEGFTWNGASIPVFFHRVCGSPMMPQNVRASCIHDRIYGLQLFPRLYCDELFYKILRHDKKNYFIAKGMYRAVRVFGASHY
jgi:hypothetical protein